MKTYKDINSTEVKKLIEKNKENTKFKIIDVRTKEEYASGKIDDAILMNLYDKDFKERLDEMDKEGVYLLYCRSGSRSNFAMNIMKSLGFEEVYNLENGILSWKN